MKKQSADKLAILASYLQMRTLMQTPADRRDGYYIDIHRNKLRSLIGTVYKPTVNLGEDMGVIELYRNPDGTRHYKTGGFSQAYRLSHRHRNGQAQQYKIQTKPMRKRAGKIRTLEADTLGSAGLHLASKFDDFTIDAMDVGKLNYWKQYAIFRLLAGEHYASRCRYGRFHAVITQQPNIATKFIRAGGELVVILDYSSMQPLSAGILAGLNWLKNCPHSIGVLSDVCGCASGGGAGGALSGAPSDVCAWVSLCEGGLFYKHFHREIQKLKKPAWVSYNRHREDLRDLQIGRFKKSVLVPMMGTLEAMVKHPVFNVMQRDFPTVAEYLIDTKAIDYRGTARLLQGFESSLVVDGLGGEFQTKYPDVPVATKHDALIVPASFKETARELMLDAFKQYGVTPMVKVEN